MQMIGVVSVKVNAKVVQTNKVTMINDNGALIPVEQKYTY